MQRTQPSQSTQPRHSTHRRHPTQPRQPTHATRATDRRLSTDPAIPALPETATLPATPALPDTATLPATPALPATATLAATPALPATATLPATPVLSTAARPPVPLTTSAVPVRFIMVRPFARPVGAQPVAPAPVVAAPVVGNLAAVSVSTRLAVPAFEALARLRGARAVHSRGALFAARVELGPIADGLTSPTVAALGGPAVHPALVRMSKNAGTPGSWPDALGIAMRLTDLPGGPVDLLFATVGRHRATGALLAPTTGWCARPYSTLLPYRADGVRVTLGLRPEDTGRARGADPQAVRDAVRAGPVAFTVVEKRARTPWAPIGRLLLDLPMPDGAADDGPGGAEPVTYEPVINAHPRLLPVRPLAAVRSAAYTGSRRGRGVDAAFAGQARSTRRLTSLPDADTSSTRRSDTSAVAPGTSRAASP